MATTFAMSGSLAKGSMMRRSAGRASQARPCLPAVRQQASRRVVQVQAAAAKPGIAQFADSIGLPTDEGLFGFKPFSEMWCGRLAMMGFVTSIVEEALTGRGTLQQIGLYSPSGPLLTGMVALLGVALVGGTASTAYKLATRKMTPADVGRYKNFLGLNNADDWKLAEREMKGRPDFATPNVDTEAIAQVRAEGMPADKVLALDDRPAADATAMEMKASSSLLTLTKAEEAQQVAAAVAEMKSRSAGEPSISSRSASAAAAAEPNPFDDVALTLKYAKDVELSNGRAAMLGFLAAVLVEAGTGQGIILQIISILKWSGLLGPMSGF